jgi:hypothetical protein
MKNSRNPDELYTGCDQLPRRPGILLQLYETLFNLKIMANGKKLKTIVFLCSDGKFAQSRPQKGSMVMKDNPYQFNYLLCTLY